MSKLTKQQTKMHNKALSLIEQDILSAEDKEFVFTYFNEGAHWNNGEAGAFFTPLGMADGLAHDALGDVEERCANRIVDLCAGIGVIAYALLERYTYTNISVVCVEINPDYVEMGKKLVPHAEWHCGDVLDKEFMMSLGHFDDAVSNPPFGRVRSMTGKSSSSYSGAEAEYKVMDMASQIADDLAFIIPKQSAGFSYSGSQGYQRNESSKYKQFKRQTGIELSAGMGYDTTEAFMGKFKNVNIPVEFAHADVSHINAQPVETESLQYQML